MDLTKAGKASRLTLSCGKARATRDLIHPGTKKQIVPRNRVIKKHLKRLGWTFEEGKGWVAEAGALKNCWLPDEEELAQQRLAADIVDKNWRGAGTLQARARPSRPSQRSPKPASRTSRSC